MDRVVLGASAIFSTIPWKVQIRPVHGSGQPMASASLWLLPAGIQQRPYARWWLGPAAQPLHDCSKSQGQAAHPPLPPFQYMVALGACPAHDRRTPWAAAQVTPLAEAAAVLQGWQQRHFILIPGGNLPGFATPAYNHAGCLNSYPELCFLKALPYFLHVQNLNSCYKKLKIRCYSVL